jgi:DNA-directed RNA polymerase
LSYRGGYLISPIELIHSNHGGGHTATLENPISAATLKALNIVQHTPWRINGWLLDVVREAWTAGSDIGGLPVAWGLPVPEPVPEAVWKAMTRDERTKWKARAQAVYGENARAESKRLYLLDCLTSARELRPEDAIWYPHFIDFRGRMYPASHRGPHPQANDLGKALIMFARGKPLGPDGLYWLMIRAANTYGQDKLALDARVQWVQDNLEAILDSARNPLDGERFWADADEPWGFLATCNELNMALEADDPWFFVSHLPIPLDGSCNGLQHLSAMGLDPVGALATNLTADPQRHDIYQDVAHAVNELLKADAIKGKAEAVHWLGKITRTTVKRAVMTTPYGVTNMGIRNQLIEDGHVARTELLGPNALAAYLRDQIVRALDQTVVSAKEIMRWLQGCAQELAKANLPIEWTTPAGTRVRQAYFKSTDKKVLTLEGEVHLRLQDPKGGINASKAALAAAPNVVHSFDAAHLQITVNVLNDIGVQNFAMVHDSYGTHACDTATMGQALRETFVDIYREDWLEKLYLEFSQQAPHLNLPGPPWRGKFDIKGVLDSPFFFA